VGKDENKCQMDAILYPKIELPSSALKTQVSGVFFSGYTKSSKRAAVAVNEGLKRQ